MRPLMILSCLALSACLPALPGRLTDVMSGDYPRLLNQSDLEALWVGPSGAELPAPDFAASTTSRLAALEARAARLRAYTFDNSALQ